VGRAAGRPVLASFAACWPQTSAGCWRSKSQSHRLILVHTDNHFAHLPAPAAHLVMGFCSTLVLERISLTTAPCGGNQRARGSKSGAQPLSPAGREAGVGACQARQLHNAALGRQAQGGPAAGRAVQQAGPQQLRWQWEPPPTMLAICSLSPKLTDHVQVTVQPSKCPELHSRLAVSTAPTAKLAAAAPLLHC